MNGIENLINEMLEKVENGCIRVSSKDAVYQSVSFNEIKLSGDGKRIGFMSKSSVVSIDVSDIKEFRVIKETDIEDCGLEDFNITLVTRNTSTEITIEVIISKKYSTFYGIALEDRYQRNVTIAEFIEAMEDHKDGFQIAINPSDIEGIPEQNFNYELYNMKFCSIYIFSSFDDGYVSLTSNQEKGVRPSLFINTNNISKIEKVNLMEYEDIFDQLPNEIYNLHMLNGELISIGLM